MTDVISLNDLTTEQIYEILDLADKTKKLPTEWKKIFIIQLTDKELL